MIGIRQPDETDWSSRLQHGSYWKLGGLWFCITPNGEFGGLGKHTVIEHDDGTITVSPSILVYPHTFLDGGEKKQSPGWHGFLERGVWRSC